MDHTCDWEILQTAILSFLMLFFWALGILSIRKINRLVERYRTEAEEIKKEIGDSLVKEQIDFLYRKAVKAMRKG